MKKNKSKVDTQIKVNNRYSIKFINYFMDGKISTNTITGQVKCLDSTLNEEQQLVDNQQSNLHFDGYNHYYWDGQQQCWIIYDPAYQQPFQVQQNQQEYTNENLGQQVQQPTKNLSKVPPEVLLQQVLENPEIKQDIDKNTEDISYSVYRDTTRNREGDPSEIIPGTPPDVRIQRRILQKKLPGKLNPLFLLKLTQKINKDPDVIPKVEDKIEVQYNLLGDRALVKNKRKQRTKKELDL